MMWYLHCCGCDDKEIPLPFQLPIQVRDIFCEECGETEWNAVYRN